MRMKALAVAASLALAAGSAGAATISNVDGPSLPFSGFDWAQGGTAYTTGFTAERNPEHVLAALLRRGNGLDVQRRQLQSAGAGHDSEWCARPGFARPFQTPGTSTTIRSWRRSMRP